MYWRAAGSSSNGGVVVVGVLPCGCLAELDLRLDAFLLEQRPDMVLEQVENFGIIDFGVDTRLVEQAEIIDEHALFLVFPEVAQVIARQSAKIFRVQVLAP